MEDIERPESEDELDSILDRTYRLAMNDEYPQALQICDWLIGDPRTQIAGYRERAAVRTRMGDISGAITDLRFVLGANVDEPADFHTLGVLLLQSGATTDAIEQFDHALTAGEVNGSAYYADSARLFLAQAKLQARDYAGARDAAARLPADYGTYINGTGIRKKEDILADAVLALQRQSSAAAPD